MTRADKAYILLVVAMIGMWGCSQGESRSASRQEERAKVLQVKCTKLEGDCQEVATARDKLQKQLDLAMREKARLQKEMEQHKKLEKECQELKAQVAARTSERDTYHSQLEEIRKSIRSLLSRVESAMPPSEPATSSATTAPTPKL